MHNYKETEPSYDAAKSVNTFGAKLLVEYRNGIKTNGSVVFSPLNLATTFQLLYYGAKGNTKAQINSVLNLANPEVEKSLAGKSQRLRKLQAGSMAYRLYVDRSIQLLDDYVNRVGKDRVISVDFAHSPALVADEINAWIKNRTRGLIPQLVSKGDITTDTVLSLVNALYFQGNWEYPFERRLTRKRTFRGVEGTQKIPFMNLKHEYLLYKKVPDLGGIIFEIPYEMNEFGLYILLPDAVDGWIEAEKRLPKYIESVFTGDFSVKGVGSLKLPKWKMEFTFNGLKDDLKQLGITDIFSARANLSGMTNSTALAVSRVIHKSKIIVNEKGTKASAAVLAMAESAFYPRHHININVNHPFLYFIVDKSDGTVLFQGTQTSIP
eukprot:g2232.t1